MKSTLMYIVFLLYANSLLAQDTLQCNKDLTWNKQGAYFFKKSDSSKQPYTGPVKCIPRSGYLNKGSLKNGVWDGVIYKFKKGQAIGFTTFKDGVLDGTTVKYSSNGLLKDSSYYSKGSLIYFKEIKRIKNKYILFIFEESTKNDTVTAKTIQYRLNIPDEIKVERFSKNMKNGISELYTFKNDSIGKLIPVLESEEIFKDGNMLSKRKYENGYLYEEEFFEGIETVQLVNYFGSLLRVQKVTPMKDGKIHGKVSTFNEEGRLILVEQYVKGIVKDVQQIKPGFENQK